MTVPTPTLAEGVRAAVQEAGRIAMGFFGGTPARWEKGPGQLVTEADIAVDRFLHGALLELAPSAAWLSEESEDDPARLGAEEVWIVDPIDGTRSFAAGLPEFTICVGLVSRGKPVLGVILNPATDELFEAVAGQGASLNGLPARASAVSLLESARIAVSRYEKHRSTLVRALPRAEVTVLGSLALKLCLVAVGRQDGYATLRRAYDWDIAAAMVILAEAGAIITGTDGLPLRLNQADPSHPGLVTAGPALHEPMLTAIREARGTQG